MRKSQTSCISQSLRLFFNRKGMKMKVLFLISAFLLDQGVSGAGSGVSVSVMEGDSVTLHTDVNINQQDIMTWYFNAIRIASINGVQKICRDQQCDERFGGRLKLDNQTGSLTIKNTRTTDSGDYKLLFGGSSSEKIFSVIITGVSADERDQIEKKSLKVGESVTLNPGEIKNTGDSKWYVNETLIAEISGDQSKICTDDQCKDSFRDRLKLDHQTGSLTITNAKTRDSGLYQLKTNSGSNRRRRSTNNVKKFVVTVSADKDPGASPAAGTVAGTVAALLVAASASAAGVIYYRHRSSRKRDLEENNQEPLRKPYSEKEEDKDQTT